MKSAEFKIGKHTIGRNHKPFIIAEMSGNHNQSIDEALKIVDAVAATGAQALKLQTYTADSLTIDHDKDEFFLSDKDSLWKGQSLYQLYQTAYTPWEWHAPIFERCKKLGLEYFSSPFDEKAVDFLDDLGVPCFKIASFENGHLPLIRKASSKGKPLIISTGMADVSDIHEALTAALEAGAPHVVLLKCTSSYPASPSDSNLRTIPHLSELFGVQVGLSDHTLGIGAAIASVAVGAVMIEKHVTFARAAGGVDSSFSMEPAELKSLVQESERAWLSMGSVHYGRTAAEEKSKVFRRSIYIIKDVKKGEKLDETNTRIIRPGYGIKPKFLEIVLGRKAKTDLKRGKALSFEDIE